MDGKELGCADGAALVDRLANHVDDSAEGLGADGHLNGVASVLHGLATHQTLSGVERDGAHVVATQVLSDLEDEAVLGALNFQGVHNGREFALELHVDDGTDDLGNLSGRGAETSYAPTNRSVTRGVGTTRAQGVAELVE